MNLDTLSEDLKEILIDFQPDNFIYSFLRVYDLPKSTITILQQNPSKLSGKQNVVILKNKILYHVVEAHEDLHVVIDTYQHEESKHKPRFVIVTDGKTFLASDLKTKESLDIELGRLPSYFAFFLPLMGVEKTQYENENPADVRASGKMAKLYDEIIKENPDFVSRYNHDLNVFLSRLLFCYFAEDTKIFSQDTNNLFLNGVGSHTLEDGSDLRNYFQILFEVLNTTESERKNIAAYFESYPYVNGGLFSSKTEIPVFNKKSRDLIIECGNLDWAKINPDIFGSMIQAVVHPGHRENLGMHYTSIPNIMKVIQPLFLDVLELELDGAGTSIKKLEKLRERIRDIRIFDPACGSGNFLIVSYRKLCELEREVIDRINSHGGKTVPISAVTLDNFYGIEIDDFAHEIAQLSLWIAQYQVNEMFEDMFGIMKPILPLSESGNITHGNAARIAWNDVCPQTDDLDNELEIYVVGNPPYLGSRNQDKEQKFDLEINLSKIKGFKNLDYISIWFYKGFEYLAEKKKIALAFVSTNSITQGEQVALFWPHILAKSTIHFAYNSFKWTNLAKGNAGVSVVVIGLRAKLEDEASYRARIYTGGLYKDVNKIGPYLKATDNIFYVNRRTQVISKNLPKMPKGNMPYDGGNLILSKTEKEALVSEYPESVMFIKEFVNAKDLLNSIKKYCIWIKDEDLREAERIPPIKSRIELVKTMRLSSSDSGAHRLAERPHQFREVNEPNEDSIIIPSTTSEMREYLPICYLNSKTIANNASFVIYHAEPFIFGVISSKMHMLWVKAVGGRLKTDIRYSSALCYNTFPFPEITDEQKEMIENQVYNILEERERHSEKTMAELYNPDTMPDGLLQAHKYLDEVIDRIYRKKQFESDEERLAHLFNLYSEMITNEQK